MMINYRFSLKNIHNFLFLLHTHEQNDMKTQTTSIQQKEVIAPEGFMFEDVKEIDMQEEMGKTFVFDGIVFCLCINGNICLKLNHNKYSIQRDELFIILPHHPFSIVDSSADLEMKNIYLSADYLCGLFIPDLNLLKQTAMHPLLQLNKEKLEELKSLHHMIERYKKREGNICKTIRKTLMHALILITVSLSQQDTSGHTPIISRQEILAQNFFDLLLQYHMVERSVSFYADKLCVSPKYLSATIKLETGFPAQNWIYEILIMKIKHYIQTTNYAIQQIAEIFNFQSSASFIRFFKQHTGHTPLVHRNCNIS